ncbi:MAG TPA: MmgE/PrpD family protein [Candidatus Acidoferrales bacterium]|nr:MmgE/PrpD family protein [Candidatus Acidoferrales bacterium]
MQENLTEKLAAYIAGERPRQLPQSIVERAKTHILDTLGAMISGSTLKPGRVAIEFVRAQAGPPEATVVATGIKTGAILAALANAMTAHADETDDAHFPTVTHPGSVILPSALAIAEREHRSGHELITAVVLGYDVMCRLNKALGREWMSERGIHAGSISSVFGAAAAAGRLLGLNAEQVRYALALAGTQASGINTWRQDPEHIDKAFCYAGAPARNGVSAALMVRAGFTATPTVFDGEENLFRAFSERPRPEELLQELGARFEISDTSIKKYPAGQPMQATLSGYFSLVNEHGLDGLEQVQKIVVRLPDTQARTINDRHMPDVNCQYLLAVAMLDGKVDFQNAHDFARMRDPKVLELKKRVEIRADAELTGKFPAVRSAIVEIFTTDGRRFETLVERVPGAPYNPLPPAEVEEKFLSLSAPVLGESRAQAVAQSVRELEKIADVAALAASLGK